LFHSARGNECAENQQELNKLAEKQIEKKAVAQHRFTGNHEYGGSRNPARHIASYSLQYLNTWAEN
jgi:hypothetical protein